MPRGNFADVVNAFDRGLPAKNILGTAFAFLDGSGDDGICEHRLDDWHTYALVFSSAGVLLSTDVNKSFILPDQRLYKWNGDGKLSGSARAKYRRRFAENLSKNTEKDQIPVWIHAWSYRGRSLLPHKLRIYTEAGFPPHHPPISHGWTNVFDPAKWRTMTLLYGPDGSKKGCFSEGNLLALLEIRLHVVLVYERMKRLLSEDGKPLEGLMLITDPLCGDNLQKNRKHGNLLAGLLDGDLQGQFNLRSVNVQNSRIGELLSDNLAGLFNDAAMALSKGKFDSRALVIASHLYLSPMMQVDWIIYGDDGEPRVVSPKIIEPPGAPRVQWE